jgi:hypothetical protein
MSDCDCGFDESRLQTDAYFDDPYPVLDELRETCRVHWSSVLRGWLLTRYKDVDACLRDTTRFSSAHMTKRKISMLPVALQGKASELSTYIDGRSLLMQDPPQHTNQRRILSRAFLPRHIASLEATTREMARDLLKRRLDDGRMDFVADLARPLPGMVLALFLGVPETDREQFIAWGDAAVALSVSVNADESIVDNALRAYREMSDYIEGILTTRAQAAPRSDFMGLVSSAEQQQGTLSHEEVVGSCINMLFAGHETSTLLLTLGALDLARFPDQRQALLDDPAKMPSAVEEMFRYEPPVVVIPARTAAVDMDLHGRALKAGEPVFNALGVASRDPREFENPTSFDVSRTGRHLDFGAGPHLCIGAPVARLEARVVFEELLSVAPEFSLDESEPLRWRRLFNVRKLEALHVRL